MYIRFCKWPVETPMICVFRSTCLCLWNKHVCWFYIRCLLGSPWWKPHGHVGPTYTYANICSQGWSYLHVDELHLNWGPILALNFTNPPKKKPDTKLVTKLVRLAGLLWHVQGPTGIPPRRAFGSEPVTKSVKRTACWSFSPKKYPKVIFWALQVIPNIDYIFKKYPTRTLVNG